MNDNLEPAKKVLRSFLSEIEEAKTFCKSISPVELATADDVSDREKEDAYIWLYADVNFQAFLHRPKPNHIPDYYKQLAEPVYLQWRQEEKDVFYRNCEMIPSPEGKISLAVYLQQLALIVSEENEHRDVWIESLRCFLQFLRDDMHLDQKGFLESLFPSQESCKGMELRKGFLSIHKKGKTEKAERRFILRRIEEAVYPIDILAASEILKNLSIEVLNGRSNAQQSAAEALGFAWLCHAVGCYHLVTREDLVFSTELGNFRPPDLSQSKQFHPTHFIGISSLYGDIDVPVSKTIYDYLQELPRGSGSDRIFNMDWTTVLRTFRNKGVKPAKRAQNLGHITFLTFMSQPDEAIGQRHLPKKEIRKTKETVTHRAI